jgi:uncharacterized membrane protein
LTTSIERWSRLMLAAYLAMMAWQVIWHGLLPKPWGANNYWLAAFALLPLLIPIAGLIKLTYRSLVWAGLLLMLYFIIGVMEMWANPEQRPAAAVQVLLTVFYLFAFMQRNRT